MSRAILKYCNNAMISRGCLTVECYHVVIVAFCSSLITACFVKVDPLWKVCFKAKEYHNISMLQAHTKV